MPDTAQSFQANQIHWSNESGSFPGRSTLVEEEKEERNYLKVFEQKYILNLFSKYILM